MRLFVGGDVAYAVHTRGYNTFNLNDPAHPVIIANGGTNQFGWKQIVASGSGLGVAAVGPNSTNDGPHNVSLYDVSDPAQTNVFLTEFPTPGLAAAVSIYNGQAFVADSQAGLQVINYLAYDNQGAAPTISLSTNFAPGVAEEGQIMRVSANVDDDVQVRNVEFYVDGVRQVADGNFPFEHRFVTPLIAQQPSFTLRARASDTGGNIAETSITTVTLTVDATPPQATRTSPPDGSRFGLNTVTTLSATFSEPIDPATLTANTFQLFSAGPDGQPGTADDVPVTGGVLSFNSDTRTAFLTFSAPLGSERYRAILTTGITDLAGNPLTASRVWSFDVAIPVYWDGGGNGTAWSDPLNWSINALPGPNDIVIIDVAGTVTVTHASGTTSIFSLQSQEPIRLTGGTLSIADQSTINARFVQSNGTLDGAATVTVNGALSWSGGTMSGSGRTVAQWPTDPRRPGQVPGQAHPGHCVWRDVVGRQSHRDKHRRRDQRAAGRHLRHSE
ncbi:MAG: Ig-like domain-containing protein [Anaerolineae bacterium]|nr:Ig-like domain-containing protein [Anaerolineae bacterium]